MDCIVAGKFFDVRQVIYRDQGYGINPNKPVFNIEIFISIQEFLDLFSNIFNNFINQCIQDDTSASEADIPELQRLGYPSLAEIFSSHPTILADLIKDYLYFDILHSLLSKNNRSDWLFAVNEIKSVHLTDSRCVLRGLGYYLL